ncbi:3-hydroxybutyrate dehydrogenase [Niveispirillum sp. KHB5.9]|uniref:3-hydroxybutyrate dehydrogenase n=1 Tax=Niveispirillum sp. KHB5.9 TaxID=3400269 RepID=UPI003A8931C1
MLKGKVAIITGSTSGIGLGIARRLAASGANVVLNGFGDAAEIEAVRAGIEAEFAVKALYSPADMTKPDQIKGMVDLAVTTLGSADILVNNAGIQHTAPITEFPAERWDSVIAINLSAVFHGMQAALPHMQAKGWGRIVNIASAHGLVASVNKAAYVAAKHGVLGVTKVAALENAESGITVNAICPGWVLTPLVQKQIDALAAREGISIAEAQVKLLSEKQPSKQFTTPEQLGDLTVFLCSDAAANIKGASLPVDGGWTAQ